MFNVFHIYGLLFILTTSSIHGSIINAATTKKDYDLNHKNYDCNDFKKQQAIQIQSQQISCNSSYEEQAIKQNRSKRNIPVLEPVRHLLNHVRDSHLNHTIHHNHENHYHHLLKETIDMKNLTMTMNNHNNNNYSNNNENGASEAIETEMEREMINESNDLRFLEVLGVIGSKLFGFLTNLRQVFAASSAPLLAASSSGSSN